MNFTKRYLNTLTSICACLTVCLSLPSCTSEDYETGDGDLSYLRAEFGEVYTNADTNIFSASLDNSLAITFHNPVKASWQAKADTLYRALLYFDKKDIEKGTSPYSIVRIPVVTPMTEDDVKKEKDPEKAMRKDPLTYESGWISENRKYLNIGVLIKTGVADEKETAQTVGAFIEEDDTTPEGLRHTTLYFLHNQNNIPQYYSSRNYCSISLKGYKKGDVITIKFNTYNGEIVKDFEI